MNYLKKLQKNRKALSPIFATLILIAIAVIAGIVVYMFTSGTIAAMTGGGTAGQEKVAVQSVGVTDATHITVYAQSTGGGKVTVDTVQLKFAGNSSIVESIPDGVSVISSTVSEVPVVVTGLESGENYMVTLISINGGSFNSPTFKGP